MTEHENDEKNGKNDNAGSRPQDSHSPPDPPPDLLLPPRGDYQTLLSFQKAEVIYDITFRFAHKYLAKNDRTIDQMIQSARSGKKRNGRSGRQGSNEDNAGRQGGGLPDGRSPPEAHSSPDSHSSQPQKPPGHRNPPPSVVP